MIEHLMIGIVGLCVFVFILAQMKNIGDPAYEAWLTEDKAKYPHLYNEKTEQKQVVEFKLIQKCVDLGYPDPGHDEYFLVSLESRRSKFWQKVLGDKEKTVLCYGERKPDQFELESDIIKYSKK